MAGKVKGRAPGSRSGIKTQRIQHPKPSPKPAKGQWTQTPNANPDAPITYTPPGYAPPQRPQGPSIPQATFDLSEQLGGPTDQELGQLETIAGRQEQLNRGQFDTQRSRVQADLARQLAEADLRRRRTEYEVGQNVDKARGELPKALTKIGQSAAARGAFSTSGREGEQTEASQQVDEYVKQQEEAKQRAVEDIERAKSEAAKSADDLLADISRQQEEYDLQVRAREIESVASARTRALDNKRTEATGWTRARVNELERSGLPEAEAQSIAINEARQRWPQVGATYINGALDPPTPKETKLATGFSKDIGGKRGKGLTSQKIEKIKGEQFYKSGGADVVREYLQRFKATGNTDSQAFLRYYVSTLTSQIHGHIASGDMKRINALAKANGVSPSKLKRMREQELRALVTRQIERYPQAMSLVLAEEGFD